MVVLERWQLLRDRVVAGHSVLFAFSHNTATGKAKIKARVEPAAGTTSPRLRALFLALLDVGQPFLESLVVVDRGHRYSDGRCAAQFWLASSAAVAHGTSSGGYDDRPDDDDDDEDNPDPHRHFGHRPDGAPVAAHDPWSGGNDPWSLGRGGPRGDSEPMRPRTQGLPLCQPPGLPSWCGGDAAAGLAPSTHQARYFDLVINNPEVMNLFDDAYSEKVAQPATLDASVQTQLALNNTIVLPAQPSLLMDMRLSERPAARRVLRRDPQWPDVRHLGREGCDGPALATLPVPSLPAQCGRALRGASRVLEHGDVWIPPGTVCVAALVRNLSAGRIQAAWRERSYYVCKFCNRSPGDADCPVCGQCCACGACVCIYLREPP